MPIKSQTGGGNRFCKLSIFYIAPIWLFTRKIYKFTQKLKPTNAHESYICARLMSGKVDLPYFELVLTTRCTLRCEACNNLMQYFSPKNAYSCSLDGILSALNTLFAVVNSIANIRIIGGEPLLFKDIAAVVAFLESSPKVKSYNIVTNATIKPHKALLNALTGSAKASITISDYEKSPNLRIKLHRDELLRIFNECKIPCHVLWQSENDAWFDPGAIYKRGRDREGIVRNFRSCLMPCVSVMSNEFNPQNVNLQGYFSKNSSESVNFQRNSSENLSENNENLQRNLSKNSSKNLQENLNENLGENTNSQENSSKNSAQSVNLTPNSKGQVFICPIASSLSRLRGLGEFEGDFLELDDTLSKQKILDFYAQDFFKACDYCRDMSAKRKLIPIAIQADKVMEIKDFD